MSSSLSLFSFDVSVFNFYWWNHQVPFGGRRFLLKAPMAILSGSLGTRGTASCHLIGLLPSYRTFHSPRPSRRHSGLSSPRLCSPRPFCRHTGLSTVHDFAVHGLSTVITDLQSTALLPSYRTSHSPRLFHRHSGLSTVHGLSAVQLDTEQFIINHLSPIYWAFYSSPLS